MEKFYGVVPPIDYAVIKSYTKAHRIYFYDAIDYAERKGETAAEHKARVDAATARFDYIASQPGYHVRDGHVRQGGKREQKGVDVLLAVEAMEHAARGNMSLAMLMSGDLDFEPLLRSLDRLGTPTRVYYFPIKASPDLLRAADDARKITLREFHGWASEEFRINHPVIELAYAQRPLDPRDWPIVKTGVWQDRTVTLHSHPKASPRLYVEKGKQLTDQSRMFVYPDIQKLELAHTLTFGEIEWAP